MVYTCLPSGEGFGWGVAGKNINAALSKMTKVVDVSQTASATVFDGPVLMAIKSFCGDPLNPNVMTTDRMVGYAFCEEPGAARAYLDKWNAYDTVVCGSTWMKGEMDRIGVRNTAVAIQGVDYDIFKPRPESPKRPGFTVFSGGKFEYRKGHDMVIAIMAAFMRERPDVHLVANWVNVWPETMHTLEKSTLIHYERASSDWRDQAAAALASNGVPMGRVTMPSMATGEEMAERYRSCHIGLFPNRVEAGTNLVLCEAIACGLPVIASQSTGHADIVPPTGQIGMPAGETVDRYVAELNIQHLLSRGGRGEPSPRGAEGARLIRETVSWEKCAASLLAALEGRV
jgi:glycosyltransferase involved in cell wall biosynthesis